MRGGTLKPGKDISICLPQRDSGNHRQDHRQTRSDCSDYADRLVVGGIVIMNIMLVTVTERTVEVGMRKAVGARRSDILLQFLIESALLATLGGVLGLGLASVLCAIIESTVGFPMKITLGYVLLAIFTSGGVGMISGIYPAYRASKLSPIVALARE